MFILSRLFLSDYTRFVWLCITSKDSKVLVDYSLRRNQDRHGLYMNCFKVESCIVFLLFSAGSTEMLNLN